MVRLLLNVSEQCDEIKIAPNMLEHLFSTVQSIIEEKHCVKGSVLGLKSVKSAGLKRAPMINPADKSAGLKRAPMINPADKSAGLKRAPMINPAGSVKIKSSSSLRRGNWTVEEEAYVARVRQNFNSGFLNAPAGTMLRSYLSEKLHCNPMHIMKKFKGDPMGKRVFLPAVHCASTAAAIDKAQAEVDALEGDVYELVAWRCMAK